MMIPLLKLWHVIQSTSNLSFFFKNPTGIVDLIIIGVFILKSKADFIDSSTVEVSKKLVFGS